MGNGTLGEWNSRSGDPPFFRVMEDIEEHFFFLL